MTKQHEEHRNERKKTQITFAPLKKERDLPA